MKLLQGLSDILLQPLREYVNENKTWIEDGEEHKETDSSASYAGGWLTSVVQSGYNKVKGTAFRSVYDHKLTAEKVKAVRDLDGAFKVIINSMDILEVESAVERSSLEKSSSDRSSSSDKNTANKTAFRYSYAASKKTGKDSTISEQENSATAVDIANKTKVDAAKLKKALLALNEKVEMAQEMIDASRKLHNDKAPATCEAQLSALHQMLKWLSNDGLTALQVSFNYKLKHDKEIGSARDQDIHGIGCWSRVLQSNNTSGELSNEQLDILRKACTADFVALLFRKLLEIKYDMVISGTMLKSSPIHIPGEDVMSSVIMLMNSYMVNENINNVRVQIGYLSNMQHTDPWLAKKYGDQFWEEFCQELKAMDDFFAYAELKMVQNSTNSALKAAPSQ